MDLEKECQLKTEETCLKEEDKKVVINFPHKIILDNRLKKQKDFNLVFSKGKRIYTNSLTLIYLKNNSLKFGISLSKKHGKAVERNKIKRLLRAVIREVLPNINDTYYIVVLPKVLEEYSYKVFKNDVTFALKKGSIINDK